MPLVLLVVAPQLPAKPSTGLTNLYPTLTPSYNHFVSKLRDLLTGIGLNPKSYAGHSFRRGGASFAYLSGVPVELIKALGDWRSDTILIYLTMPLTISLHSANMLSKSILIHTS